MARMRGGGALPENGSRWVTSASEIGRGVLLYGEQRAADARGRQIRSDADLARELQNQEQQGGGSGSSSGGGGGAGRADRVALLPCDRTTLTARPPREAPAAREVSEGIENLRKRLASFGLTAVPVSGDGSCQFRSLSYAMWGTDEHHSDVRQAVCDHLAKERSFYEVFVDEESWESYLGRMRGNGWGDHLTLQAFADVYERSVHLVTSYEDRGFIQIVPASRQSAAGDPLLIGFWAEVHYNPLKF